MLLSYYVVTSRYDIRSVKMTYSTDVIQKSYSKKLSYINNSLQPKYVYDTCISLIRKEIHVYINFSQSTILKNTNLFKNNKLRCR